MNKVIEIDYLKIYKHWNTVEKIYFNQYSLGYKTQEPELAIYRFNKELSFLNNNGVFGGNYLDLGCGTGNFLFEWKDKFDNLVGIDFSKIMVEFARKRCKGFKNIKIYKDNVLNFSRYTRGIDSFNFIFIGGCLMYLNNNDVILLLKNLSKKIEKGGVIIFRESIAKEKRIFVNSETYTTIRRTIEEYKKSIPQKNDYNMTYFQNYAYNYAMEIAFYWKLFPFLKNKVNFFKNLIIEFIFLFLPLKIFTLIKGNMTLNYFFVIKKNG